MLRLFVFSVLLASLCILSSVECSGNCRVGCTREYAPICAQQRRLLFSPKCTFNNLCLLNARRCINPHERWEVLAMGRCSKESRDCKRLTQTL